MKILKKVTFLAGIIPFTFIGCGGAPGGDQDPNNLHDRYITGGPNSPVVPASDTGNWNQLKSQYQCQGRGGQGRMGDRTFTLSSQGSTGGTVTRLAGAMSEGSYQGPVAASYMGRNYDRNDLIYIQKMNVGGSIRYNIVLSLCTYITQGPYGDSIEYIGPNAGLSNFQLSAVLYVSTSATPGQVTRGQVQFNSQNYRYGQITRVFAPINRGGSGQIYP